MRRHLAARLAVPNQSIQHGQQTPRKFDVPVALWRSPPMEELSAPTYHPTGAPGGVAGPVRPAWRRGQPE